MFKLSNGIVDEDEVAAVIKHGPNWQVVLKSGYVLATSAEEAAGLRDLVDPPAKFS